MAPLAAAPLVEASRPRSRRHLAPCLIAAAALSAVAGARRGPSAAAAAAMGAAAAALDGDGSGDDTHDDYAYSYLYECSDGDPQVEVATSYANGSWGSIAGEWYVVAGTQAASENLAGDCCRMKFALGDGGAAMSQWMWYEGDDGGGAAVGYEWNFTGSVEYDGEAGVWSATRGARARARARSGMKLRPPSPAALRQVPRARRVPDPLGAHVLVDRLPRRRVRRR